MKKQVLIYSLIAVVVLAGIIGISIFGVKNSGKAYIPEHEYALLELGSEDCAPCQRFKDDLAVLQNAYGKRIDIKFFDIESTKAGASYANHYKIKVKPTFIFVDKTGKEVKRIDGETTKENVARIFAELWGIE